MWIIATALLEDVSIFRRILSDPGSRLTIDIQLTAGNSCTAPWFYQYWSFYWGGYWLKPEEPTMEVACGEWVVVHAFGWLGSLLWLATGSMVRDFSFSQEFR